MGGEEKEEEDEGRRRGGGEGATGRQADRSSPGYVHPSSPLCVRMRNSDAFFFFPSDFEPFGKVKKREGEEGDKEGEEENF